MAENFVLKGNICYSQDSRTLICVEQGYLVCADGESAGVYKELPQMYAGFPLTDYGDRLIVPGLTDLHLHAPQYSFRGLGMDLELLEWLNTRTFPEEAKYSDMEYAGKAYTIFAENMKHSATTRACIFATMHREATELLMDLMEETGLKTMVGKVNMDRNSPDILVEETEESLRETRQWLEDIKGRYRNTAPILTPRFIPTCSDTLMEELKKIQMEYDLPVQSHLSENKGEIDWVKELCPWSEFYGDAYDHFRQRRENHHGPLRVAAGRGNTENEGQRRIRGPLSPVQHQPVLRHCARQDLSGTGYPHRTWHGCGRRRGRVRVQSHG